jgi:hypothetical protein
MVIFILSTFIYGYLFMSFTIIRNRLDFSLLSLLEMTTSGIRSRNQIDDISSSIIKHIIQLNNLPD